MFRIHWQAREIGKMMGVIRTALRRTALVGVLAAAAVLAFATNALAVSGTAIKIAEPVRFGPPSVAVDGAGTAYAAWANTTGLGGKGDTVEYCALPAGATGCAHAGTLFPAGSTGGKEPVVGQVQVIADGSTIIVLAEVYGAATTEDEPVQEWTSTDGGATWVAVDSGKSVADATINADTGPLNALIVPGVSALGYAFVTAGGPPTLDEFPLTSTPQCSLTSCPPDEAFATLEQEPELTLHPLSNEPGSFASELGPEPGVLGVYETLGKPGCASGVNDTAFVYGSGAQSSANSYDISHGKSDSAWKAALSPGDCEVQYPAVGGGPSGLGVAEKDTANGTEIYHRFNQTTASFEPSTTTIANEGGLDTSVSQDGAGGIYVTYLGNAEDAIRLAYSSTGGASWTGPATLNPNTDLGANHLVSSVGSSGQGWAVWDDGESVYAQQFDAADAIPPATPTTLITSQTSGTTTGASITIPAGTLGESDRATITGANASTATGTVNYVLYGNSSCTGTPLISGSATVTGGAAGPVTVTAALAPGTYYWRAAYSGDSHQRPQRERLRLRGADRRRSRAHVAAHDPQADR